MMSEAAGAAPADAAADIAEAKSAVRKDIIRTLKQLTPDAMAAQSEAPTDRAHRRAHCCGTNGGR
jgi:thiamine phosphate synthase YjbQ (UPF0047 family)